MPDRKIPEPIWGRKIRAIQASKGLSDPKLAEMLGMEFKRYNQYILGSRKPPPEFFPNVAKALNTSIDQIFANGAVSKSDITANIAELDVQASAGPGSAPGNVIVEAAAWNVPRDWLRSFTQAPFSDIKIISVLGDSMAPTLAPGHKLIVDTNPQAYKPSPPGIFVIWDGVGLVVKRLEVLSATDPLRIRLSSDNPAYAPYEALLDDINVQGRVVAVLKVTRT